MFKDIAFVGLDSGLLALGVKVFPHLFINHATAAHHHYAWFSHHIFNHSDCADKVRNIAETGDVGELPDEFPVGVVHSAEHHGDIAQAGIIALQHGISGLIIENNDNIGSPIGQFIDKKRSTDKFILVSQFITIQEKIVDFSFNTHGRKLFFQCLVVSFSIMVAFLIGMYDADFIMHIGPGRNHHDQHTHYGKKTVNPFIYRRSLFFIGTVLLDIHVL